ncbi:rhamnogalacturonan acetylesterase [Paenibacillus rhizoplanae]
MPTIYIAGDSTAAQKGGGEWPMAGWGEYLQQYVSRKVRIENRAINGRSTRSFLAEGRLADMERDFLPGDFLLIQFGHNDQKLEDPLRYTEPHTDYRENLKVFIDSARSRGSFPVLLTSVSRRRFTTDGEPDPQAVGLYPQVMREVAGETGTPLLDIFLPPPSSSTADWGPKHQPGCSCTCRRAPAPTTRTASRMTHISPDPGRSRSHRSWPKRSHSVRS